MPDKDASTPRIFLIRHGETEWSQSGRYTGSTEIPLTAQGEEQIRTTGKAVYGEGRLVNPLNVAKVWVSPRERALKTYQLFSGKNDGYEVAEDLAEWNYGEYEGLLPNEIKEKRASHGLDKDKKFNIWQDGCEGGESPEQVGKRVDGLIAKIKDFQASHMKDTEPKDVLIFAHGHIIRALAKRWLGFDVSNPMHLMLPPGGVAILSYEHHSVDEPALVLGMNFPSKS